MNTLAIIQNVGIPQLLIILVVVLMFVGVIFGAVYAAIRISRR